LQLGNTENPSYFVDPDKKILSSNNGVILLEKPDYHKSLSIITETKGYFDWNFEDDPFRESLHNTSIKKINPYLEAIEETEGYLGQQSQKISNNQNPKDRKRKREGVTNSKNKKQRVKK